MIRRAAFRRLATPNRSLLETLNISDELDRRQPFVGFSHNLIDDGLHILRPRERSKLTIRAACTGSVQRLYGGMPNPTVVIDVDGKIALKMAWTGGEELDRYLERFLAGGARFDAELAKSVKVQGPGKQKEKGK